MFAAARHRYTSGPTGPPGLDPAALTYQANIIASGSSISPGNLQAASDLFAGCRADPSPIPGVSNWDAIKEMCLFAGPDDHVGALIAIKGNNPTPSASFAGNHSRVNGLNSGGSRHVSSNRDNSDDPQNNQSVWTFMTTRGGLGSTAPRFAGTTPTGNATELITGTDFTGTNPRFRSQSTTLVQLTVATGFGFIGVSRHLSGSVVCRAWGTQATLTSASAAPRAGKISMFANTGGASPIDARLLGYGIGEAVDMALLDARLTAYRAALT